MSVATEVGGVGSGVVEGVEEAEDAAVDFFLPYNLDCAWSLPATLLYLVVVRCLPFCWRCFSFRVGCCCGLLLLLDLLDLWLP